MEFFNETIKTQLNHKSIRKFKEEVIPSDVFNTLMEVARRTATSTGIQASSIIRITDNELKKKIAEICKQEYVGTAAELLIFLVDNFRNHNIALEKGLEKPTGMYMNQFFSGYTDACIMAQNVVVAAESLGIGTVYLGSILNDIEKLCELLKLPKYTFPVVGLALGYPDQEPQLKPRMDMSLRVFENEYKVFENYLDEIKEYDEEMTTYYDLRNSNRRVDSFSNQIVKRLEKVHPTRKYVLKDIKKQGFDLSLDD
ncbi:MAG TPA: oxygen-insensitive NADPH nitroreductase [Acholeplasmataceae bacterium]|jgi:nitroreductase|nr:oxygen-insensitive NADPH nitroreductase [Acholeplasmataceae bacterium]